MECKQKHSEKAFQKAVLTIKGPKPLELRCPQTAPHPSDPLEATGKVRTRSASAPAPAVREVLWTSHGLSPSPLTASNTNTHHDNPAPRIAVAEQT